MAKMAYSFTVLKTYGVLEFDNITPMFLNSSNPDKTLYQSCLSCTTVQVFKEDFLTKKVKHTLKVEWPFYPLSLFNRV